MTKNKKTFTKKLKAVSNNTINALIKQIQTSTSGGTQLNAKIKRTYLDPSVDSQS